MKKLLLLSTLGTIFIGCSSVGNKTESNSNELKLNFTNFSELNYDFRQKNKSVQNFNAFENEIPDTNQSFINGVISLKTQGDTIASLNFKDFIAKSLFFGKKDTASQKIPAQVLQGFNEFGENQINSAYNQKFISFFPLPYRVTQMEDNIYKFPVSMPFNANGSALLVKGQSTFKILDTVEVNSLKCIKVQCLSEYNNLEIPETLEGEYFCNSSMTFNGIFAFEKGYFLSGKVKSIVEYKLEFKQPNSEELSKINAYSLDEYEYTLKN